MACSNQLRSGFKKSGVSQIKVVPAASQVHQDSTTKCGCGGIHLVMIVLGKEFCTLANGCHIKLHIVVTVTGHYTKVLIDSRVIKHCVIVAIAGANNQITV